MDTLNGAYQPMTSTLSGGLDVVFDVPWTEASDTERTDPVEFWLRVMPTASQEDPD